MSTEIIKEIDKAIQAHLRWTARLRTTIQHNILTYEEVSNHKACAFGEWIVSKENEYVEDKNFQSVVRLHKEFHDIAGEIVNLTNVGMTKEATLKLDGAYNRASSNLVLAMVKWREEC
jgi:hypothetical protein